VQSRALPVAERTPTENSTRAFNCGS
jgi:hypothetical protein